MSDIKQKRAWVADLYSGSGWKAKVKRMPDDQIVAIYLRERQKPPKPKPKPKESSDDTLF